jgi:hypothetical protein
MPHLRKLRVSNPRRKKNVSEVLIMANSRRRRRNKSYRSRNRKHSSHKARNPRGAFRRRHHRRNPADLAGFNAKQLLKLAGGATVGVVGSKYLAQTILGGSNAGTMGALAQGIATVALGWVTAKLDKEVATGVIAGGLGVTLWSLIQQYTGTGGNMSGLGDPEMARFLGDFKPGSMAVPAMFSSPAPLPTPSQASGRRRG